MANARVSQSVTQLIIVGTGSTVRVSQSVIQLVMIAGSPPPPPPAAVALPTTGGIPYPLSSCGRKNAFDECLEQEIRNLKRIRFPVEWCAIPRQFRNLLPWDEDRATPEGAVPIYQTGGIVTPAPAAGDQIVTEFRLNPGMWGLLSGFYFMYSGTGFVQGSGDIVTRLQVNQHYLKDLSNNPYLLGSPQLPIPMTEGHLVQPSQTVRAICNVPNLSGNIQVGQSTISAGLIGFFWGGGFGLREIKGLI